MRINKILETHKNKKSETVVERVYETLQQHPDEAFRYDDEDLHSYLPNDPLNSIDWALYQLTKDGRIDEYKVSPKVAYFGSKMAIESLKNGLKR